MAERVRNTKRDEHSVLLRICQEKNLGRSKPPSTLVLVRTCSSKVTILPDECCATHVASWHFCEFRVTASRDVCTPQAQHTQTKLEHECSPYWPPLPCMHLEELCTITHKFMCTKMHRGFWSKSFWVIASGHNSHKLIFVTATERLECNLSQTCVTTFFCRPPI